MKVATDSAITIVIPLDQNGDIALMITGPDGRPFKPVLNGKGCAIVFNREVDAGFEGSGKLVCLILRFVKPVGPIS